LDFQQLFILRKEKEKVRKALFLLATVIFYLPLVAQENSESIIDEYDIFYDYTHWGFSVMPVIYKGPQFSENGTAKIKIVNNVPTIQFAFRYHFNHAKALSFNTGLIYTWTPRIKYTFNLREDDVFKKEDSFFKNDVFSDSYFLIPLNFEYKLRVDKNLYLNVNWGIAGAMRGGFSASDKHKIIVDFQEESIEVFGFNYKSKDFYFNAQMSTGLYIVFDKVMLRTNLLYNKSFSDIMIGEYSFRGLRISPSEKGKFSFSGDYFGISTTVYFKRKTK